MYQKISDQKQQDRERLREDVERFLKSGGAVERADHTSNRTFQQNVQNPRSIMKSVLEEGKRRARGFQINRVKPSC